MPAKLISERFVEALQYATRLHSRQERKGTRIPYISHLLGVTALVLEDGGDEDEAIAALLHDAIEDQGGEETLQEIQIKFGDRVADIVEGCTDAYTIPKLAWRSRKEKYIERLRQARPEVVRVSLADKLYNARSIVADLRRVGPSVWSRFEGNKDGTLWYYRSLAEVFEEITTGWMVVELEHTVSEMERPART